MKHMQKYSITLCTLGLLYSIAIESSHTFLTPRQITTDPTFELALTDYHMFHQEDGGTCKIEEQNFQLYFKPFVQRSTKRHKVASYFLPNNKPCAAVREHGTGDINPLWFDVISPIRSFYSSTLSLSPRRTTYGAVITFYADLNLLTDGLWLLVNTTAMGASHSMDLHESNITGTAIPTIGDGTIPGFTDMCDGLNNPAWCGGKIACCGNTRTKAGLDDIQVKLGYTIEPKNAGHVAPYAVLTIPTGSKPKSKYLFEPLVGSNHASLGAGLNIDFDFSCNQDYRTALLIDCKYRYVFSATEIRSFDLTCTVNGGWSRYLLVATESEPLTTLPGINYFTMPSKITPGNTIDLWFALHHQWNNWDFEFGYTLWWRQREKVSLKCCKGGIGSGTIGIYDMAGACLPSPTSASTATIAQSIANGSVISDATFIPLSFKNLNLSSASQPRALSNKVYAATSGHYDYTYVSTLYGIGSSYEIGSNNNALTQWAIWATLGLDF